MLLLRLLLVLSLFCHLLRPFRHRLRPLRLLPVRRCHCGGLLQRV
jgi:hypothetical protein